MRILFVQTHPDSARIIGRLLRLAGHDVTTVDTLARAWQALQGDANGNGEDPNDHAIGAEDRGAHQVILFGGVEVSDGRAWDFMPRVKQVFDCPGVVMSGYGMEEDFRRSEAAGFSAHLIKPTRYEDLIDALNRARPETAGA